MRTPTDLTGQKFNRWTALRAIFTEKGNRWLCRCDCGEERLVGITQLRTGTSKSCGCYRVEHGRTHGRTNTKSHGEGSNGKETPEYQAWAQMKTRCQNQNHRQYKHYGARGITVCERWQTYVNFLEDMGRRPSDEYSLDRIDNDSGYSPENCRWATQVEQNNNQRPGVRGAPISRSIVEIGGVTKTVSEWLIEYGVNYETYRARVSTGMSPIEALQTGRLRPGRKRSAEGKPIEIDGVTKPIGVWLAEAQISYATFYKRVQRGMTVPDALKLGRVNAVFEYLPKP